MKIPFTKLEITFRKQNDNVVEISKEVAEQFFNTSMRYAGFRPMLDPRETVGDEQILMPVTPMPIEILFDVAKYSDVLRTVHQNLRKEIFRHGYEVIEVFASKCEECAKEFENYQEECDECGSKNLREPDNEQKKVLVKFLKDVNDNGQDLINVSEELNDDLETVDDCYLLCLQDYFHNGQGDLIGTVPVEFLRVDPRWIRLIADKKGRPGFNKNGDMLMVCPEHRHDVRENVVKCPTCQRDLIHAHFRSEEPGGKFVYYGKDEITHESKYNPSLTYGFSVIYSVWMKVVTLMNMDEYMKAYYSKQRPPKGLLFVNTPNMDSLTKAWQWMMDEYKKNPHMIPPIAIEQTAGTKGNLVTFIDMMKTLDEMQYTESRNEMRRQIGAAYGVMPLFQADLSTSGGLNNEGLQITVTNRAVRDGQGIYNEKIYPWVTRRLQVTDYKVLLVPNEEQDLMHEEELKGKKIDNAMKMQMMGFDVTLTEEDEFEYDPTEEPVERPEMGMGGMGGLTTPKPQMGAGSGSQQSFGGEPTSVGKDTSELDKSLLTIWNHPDLGTVEEIQFPSGQRQVINRQTKKKGKKDATKK